MKDIGKGVAKAALVTSKAADSNNGIEPFTGRTRRDRFLATPTDRMRAEEGRGGDGVVGDGI